MMRLVLVGTSHHHAPVELREQVAVDREHSQALAARLAGEGREAACLSTCNRTELFVAADDSEQAERDAVAALASLGPEVEPALYRLQDRAAAHHLFRVAAGLDSLVPGEGVAPGGSGNSRPEVMRTATQVFSGFPDTRYFELKSSHESGSGRGVGSPPKLSVIVVMYASNVTSAWNGGPKM